jgi:hypothetical protein
MKRPVVSIRILLSRQTLKPQGGHTGRRTFAQLITGKTNRSSTIRGPVAVLGMTSMKTERMPWTCRWSEYRPATPAPMWLDEWLGQWACLADEARPVSEVGRCDMCRRWEPRHGWTEADRAGRQRG